MQLETKNAIYNYDEIDKDIVQELEEKFNSNLDRIYDYFETDERYKTTITIIPTKEEWDRIVPSRYPCKNGVVPKWLVGLSSKDEGIFLLSIKEYDKTSHAFKEEEYEKAINAYNTTALHEYIHHIHRKWINSKGFDNFSYYTCEGIAQLLAGQKTWLHKEIELPIDEILQNVHYDESYLIIKYIDEYYPHEEMLDILLDKDYARKFLKEHFDEIKEYYKKDQVKVR